MLTNDVSFEQLSPGLQSLIHDIVLLKTVISHNKNSDNKLTLLHSERPKLHKILSFLSAVGLSIHKVFKGVFQKKPVGYCHSCIPFQ